MPTVQAAQALALPPDRRGAVLLALPEDQWFDRKSNRIAPRDLADSIIGFANADGGTVVIGLHDGRVQGTTRGPSGRLSAWQQAAFDFTIPIVRCRVTSVACVTDAGNNDTLVVVEVEPSDRVHSNQRDEVFLRVGDENRKLTFGQRQELIYDKGQAAYETSPVIDGSLDDLDTDLLAPYAEAARHPDAERLLSARGLLTRDGQLTVGAVLLFARNPQRWFPETSVRILRYRGDARGTGVRQQLLDDRRIDGPIPLQLHAAREQVIELAPTRRALRDGRFREVGAIPEDAWLEAVVNACAHRSYSISGDHIRLEIFDDRIEVHSPGRFPGIANPDDPWHVKRFARNPRIARALADLSFGQELGEGIRRMFEEMRIAGLADPTYAQTAGSVSVSLSAKPVDRAREERLSLDAREILQYLRGATQASTGELVNVTGRSRPFTLRQLSALQDAGVIEWVGHSRRDPRAYWTLAR